MSTTDTTSDINVDDDFDIEDADTRAELGLPPIEDVPEALQFSSKADTGRKIERRSITIDDQRFVLTRPSDYTLYLYAPKLTSPDGGERLDAMMKFLDVVLDRDGGKYLLARMTDPANNFNPEIPPKIVATVLDLWGNKTVAELYRKINAEKGEESAPVPPTPIGANRSQRRQAAKKAAKKAPAKKAAPRKSTARK